MVVVLLLVLVLVPVRVLVLVRWCGCAGALVLVLFDAGTMQVGDMSLRFDARVELSHGDSRCVTHLSPLPCTSASFDNTDNVIKLMVQSSGFQRVI